MKKKKKARKRKKIRKINKKKRFKKRSLRRRRIGKSKKRQKKKVKQLTRRKKVRSKKTKRRKNFFKKARTSGFKKSIKKRFKFSFSLGELLEKIASPIVNKIRDYQKKKQLLIKEEERRRQKQIRAAEDLRKNLLKQEIKEEKIAARTRKIELHSFLREEIKNNRLQAQAKQKKFLEEVKLEKTLERFRARELEEIKILEKFSLSVEKDEFKSLEVRIQKIKDRYRDLRISRVRKRVEELVGSNLSEISIEDLRKQEQDYLEKRRLISISLESFRRSASSLIYQICKRHLPKSADLIRVIDRVFEDSAIIIREDLQPDDNFLILISLDLKKDLIVVEDKIKNELREYNKNEIFKFGDDMVDSLILYLERIRETQKKAS